MTTVVWCLVVLAVCGAWWWKYSREHALRAIPPADELKLYLAGLMDMLGLPPAVLENLRTDTVVSDGFLLHLDVFPKEGAAATVVFVPGTSVYALAYAEFMYKLSQRGFNVVGFDPRGHGQSQGLRGSYTIGELVRDASAVVRYARRHFGPDVFVAGSSQGGIVAFYTAASDRKLRGAVCHNLADLSDPETLQLVRYPALARVLKPLLALARLLPEFRVPVSAYLDLAKEPTRLFGNAKKFLESDPLAVRSISLKAFASLASTPPPCPVEIVGPPVMIIQAEYDNIFPLKYVEKIYARLPDPKKLYLARGCPHLVLTDHVDEILPPVETWLRDMLARPQDS